MTTMTLSQNEQLALEHARKRLLREQTVPLATLSQLVKTIERLTDEPR